MRFSVRVPASSANLGPGFDSLALALTCYLAVDVDTEGNQHRNAQQAEIGDGSDLVQQSMLHLARSVGRELPAASVSTNSDIPVARGLGSSAAAIIAGMVASNRLLGDPLTREELMGLASAFESHADNLAAALFGGVVLAVPVDGAHHVERLTVKCPLEPVLFIPPVASLTADARSAVPQEISRGDAVFTASRCALLVHALASGKPELLREAMRDRMHQPYRAALYPHLADTIEGALEAGAYGACLSGAGPSVLALAAPESAPNVAGAMKSAGSKHGIDGHSEILEIESVGACIFEG